MIEQTIGNSKESKYVKALFTGEYKSYKTVTLVANALGLMPWQKNGGIVSKPEDLNILAFDTDACVGLKQYLVEVLGADPAVIDRVKIWNFEDDVRAAYSSTQAYDHTFYNTLVGVQAKLAQRAAADPGGTMVVIASSLTVMAMALERATLGAPVGSGDSGKGIGDRDKFGQLKRQLLTIQNIFNTDLWHMFWEAHVLKITDESKETLQVSGSAGRNWGINMSQVFRLQRGTAVKPKLEQVVFNTRPSTEFMAGGRNFSLKLDPVEPDLTVALHKLGLKVGLFGKPK